MKAITIWQPWASAIALGDKCFETRGWSTDYRGPIAIHAAAKAPTKDIIDLFNYKYAWGETSFDLKLEKVGNEKILSIVNFSFGEPHYTYAPLGDIIAIADLIDCVKITKEFRGNLPNMELTLGDYRLGRYAWKLENVKKLDKPIPYKGQQWLWNANI